jgi:hypothetical protein
MPPDNVSRSSAPNNGPLALGKIRGYARDNCRISNFWRGKKPSGDGGHNSQSKQAAQGSFHLMYL